MNIKSFDTKPFCSLVETWKAIYKDLHDFSDKVYDSFGKEVSVEDWKKTKDTIFPYHKERTYDKFWFVKTNLGSSETVSRDTAYRTMQNGHTAAALQSLAGEEFVSGDGPYKQEAEDLVRRFMESFKSFTQLAKEIFVEADTNKNGTIELDEFSKVYAPLLCSGADVEQVYNQFDNDHDKKLTLQETNMLLGKLLQEKNPHFISNNKEIN